MMTATTPIPTEKAVPAAAVTKLLARHSREEIEGFVAVAIDLLDLADGDPDLEDATDAEDDFHLTRFAVAMSSGAGCDVGDPGGCQHDGREHDDGY